MFRVCLIFMLLNFQPFPSIRPNFSSYRACNCVICQIQRNPLNVSNSVSKSAKEHLTVAKYANWVLIIPYLHSQFYYLKINYIFSPCARTWRGKRVMVEQWGHLEPGQKYPFPPENMVTRHQTENSFLPQPQTAHKLYKSWQIHNPVNKPLDLINFLIKATKQLRKATKNVVSRNS